MDVREATGAYERWLRQRVPLPLLSGAAPVVAAGATYAWLALAMSGLILCCSLCACTEMDGSDDPSEQLSYGVFHGVRIYHTQLPAQHLAVLLSGDGGWGAPLPEIARRLSAEGTLVAGVDVRDLFARLERDPRPCVSPGSDLTDLAHYLQQRYALPDAPPGLIGHSAGATLAYIVLVESPAGSVAGALTLSFCADLDLLKPLCAGLVRSVPRRGGVRLLASSADLPAPWIALHGLDDTVCPAADAREFAGAVRGARFVGVPQVDHSYRHTSRWWPGFDTAWQELLAAGAGTASP